MAQHIRIIKINESGESLEDIKFNFADVVNILEETDGYQEKYPWIATIDPYGDTFFNHIQIPYIVAELKKLHEEKKGLLSKDILSFLISFLENINTHEYIKFIGD